MTPLIVSELRIDMGMLSSVKHLHLLGHLMFPDLQPRLQSLADNRALSRVLYHPSHGAGLPLQTVSLVCTVA